VANIKLSCVIPSYKDPLLHKTIDSLLKNSALGDQLEVIPVLDGYWPKDPIIQDDRVRVVHLGTNVGMRRAINAGVRVARGEFLLRADEHNMFGDKYDLILTTQTESNWIVTPRRYFLDADKWEVMDIPPVDFMKLKIVRVSDTVRKFSGVERAGDDTKPIQESMAMQGSCWVMPHKWWDDVIGELENEGYGPHYQDSHEMVFKTWQHGGKLMVNKNTWHAHKHRSFPRTHNNGTKENPSNNEACWTYSLKVWEDYFVKEIEPKWKV
jgi:glycosyltransferase involved in cell wall biosynthesis